MAIANYRDLARSVLPADLFAEARPEELIWAFSIIFQNVEAQASFWAGQAKITNAVGASGQPDWLNQHAKDRGTARQNGETDAALRTRLQQIVPTAVTRPNLLSTAQAAATEAGLGTVFALELKYDQSYFVDRGARSGTGGTFTAGSGTTMFFEPTAAFAAPLDLYDVVAEHRLVISGAASAGNDGTFPITGIVGDTLQFTNASGVAEADASVSWTIAPHDSLGNRLDGFHQAYLDRGFRIGTLKPTMILIIPYPATEALRLSIEESMRVLKAAGFAVLVERRETP